MVGVKGFEPPAPCSQSTCATRLRYTPVHLPRVRSRRRHQIYYILLRLLSIPFLKISTTFFFLIEEGLVNKTSPEPQPFGACFAFMEMRGVEPLSEGSLAGLSTGVVCDLEFPHPAAHRRAARVSSFMLRVSSQSFDVLVPRVNDGGNRTRGQSGPPSRH